MNSGCCGVVGVVLASVVQVVVTMTMRLVIIMPVMKSMTLVDFTNDSGGSWVNMSAERHDDATCASQRN